MAQGGVRVPAVGNHAPSPAALLPLGKTDMHRQQTPIVKDLVLVGGGHSHVTVLNSLYAALTRGTPDSDLRDVHTPYSGMLPGFLAGHHADDDMHINWYPCRGLPGPDCITTGHWA